MRFSKFDTIVVVALLLLLFIMGVGIPLQRYMNYLDNRLTALECEPVTVICECTCEQPTTPTDSEDTTEPTEQEVVTEPTETIDPSYLGEFKLTAYCPCTSCCGKWADGITSTGTTAKADKTIAVDPKVIPYGTEVVINGNTYVAEDCGKSIKGNRIDIYFDSHDEALEFGVQYADVYLGGE